MPELIFTYFKELSGNQKEKLSSLESIYKFWNAQINVISRKDLDEFYTRHVLHSLAIAKQFQFIPGTEIMDLGTGGGFPGIPLAIMFPDVNFLLTDSIGKKIKVVNEVVDQLQLKNVKAIHTRSEEVNAKFDFVITRAVAEFNTLVKWSRKKFLGKSMNHYENGIICLKGGNLELELEDFKDKIEVFSISDYFKEPFFDTKKIIYLSSRFI